MPRDHTSARPSEIPAELVLAAIERADRHRARDVHAVPVWAILEHLGIARRSAAARQVRGRLDALKVAGRIEGVRLHGIPAWQITAAGRRYLQRQRRAGNVPELPESPQHAAWRHAHTLAGQEIERFKGDARGYIGEALGLIDADQPAGSDDLYAIGERLQFECRRLASATYCLREWQEPSDDRPDLDGVSGDPGEDGALLRARRAGRRNPGNWQRAVA